MRWDDYQRALDLTGGEAEPLPEAERRALLQEWRQAFAAGLYAATGRWRPPNYEWHVFSFGYARALKGEKAAAAYAAERPEAVVVCPESAALPAFRLSGGALPNFRAVVDDVYVWPADLAWTMAFTHEESMGLGPFFSRREWVFPGATRATKRRRRRT